MPLDLTNFTRGFVAALATKNLFSVQPKRPEQIRAFHEIKKLLEQEVERAKKDGDEDWFFEVVKLRNRISPSTSGNFDQLETALRDLQLSLTESPNLSYVDIDFTISVPFAESTLGRFTKREQTLIKSAAETFLKNIAA